MEGYVEAFFIYFYLSLIMITIVISFAAPINKVVALVKVIMWTFGLLLLMTLSGVVYFLTESGIFVNK